MTSIRAFTAVIIWIALCAVEAGYITWQYGLFVPTHDVGHSESLGPFGPPDPSTVQLAVQASGGSQILVTAALLAYAGNRRWSRPLLITVLMLSAMWDIVRMVVHYWWVQNWMDLLLLFALVVAALVAAVLAPPSDLFAGYDYPH